MSTSTPTNNSFLSETLKGLRQSPKQLSSKYFYDERGDELFREIMKLPEYYLTKAEFEILETQSSSILKKVGNESLNIVELGAGDGMKTKLLLLEALEQNRDIQYLPIDISANILRFLADEMKKAFPTLAVKTRQGEYFETLGTIAKNAGSPARRNLILFLGSSIGNMKQPQAADFLHQLHKAINPGDFVLIGFDLAKDPDLIRAAYNDSKGVTRAFNLNLLTRMNRELGANFQVDHFKHYPVYNPIEKAAKSYLISLKEQTVTFQNGAEVSFGAYEPIKMELSQKYDRADVEALAQGAGFEVQEHFYDCKHYFINSLWKKV